MYFRDYAFLAFLSSITYGYCVSLDFSDHIIEEVIEIADIAERILINKCSF